MTILRDIFVSQKFSYHLLVRHNNIVVMVITWMLH